LPEEGVADGGIGVREICDKLEANWERKVRVINQEIHMVNSLYNPVSAISRIVCLIAQTTLSMNKLNCGGGRESKASDEM